MFQRALAIDEKSFGPDHTRIAQSLRGLAAVYANQARYFEAERLHKQSFAIFENVLGPDHPIVAELPNKLARIYLYDIDILERFPLREVIETPQCASHI